VTVEFDITPYIGWDYYVGMGVGTSGVYLDPATHVGVHGGLEVEAGAGVSLAGLIGVDLELGAGIRVSAGVGLADPDPRDGRIYLDELARRGNNLADAFANALTFQMQGEMYGYADLVVNLPWPLPDITLRYEGPCFTVQFGEDRIIPCSHLGGVEAGRRVSVLKIDPASRERLGLLATATVGEGGWVDLPEPIIVQAGEAFIAVPERGADRG